MNLDDVYTKLCYYDKRNPVGNWSYDLAYEPPEGECYCDNCFRGKHELACRIIELENELTKLLGYIKGYIHQIDYANQNGEISNDGLLALNQAAKLMLEKLERKLEE